MRVWQVIGGSSFGGGTYVVSRISQALLEQGFEVTVVASEEHSARHFWKLGCEVVDDIRFPREISPLADARGILRLAARMRRRGCDLAHTHTSKGGVAGRLAARLAGVGRVVHHVHGFAFDPIFTPAGRLRFYAAIERLIAPLAQAMIFVCPADMEMARRLRILRTGHIAALAPNGVDAAPEAPRCRAEAAHGLKIGFLGRLSAQKGVDLLIDAVSGLDCAGDLEVVLVGDGPERGRLEERARRCGCAARFHFTGHRQDALAVAREMDVIALPSRWEGHSIALLEAMALGRPVVTTRIKGNVDTVTSGVDGILVEPGDVAALRGALQLVLLDGALRERIGEAARRTVIERFPSSRMVAKVLRVYRQLGLPVSVPEEQDGRSHP
jgi:glycosyltransferase involved in cell wall biosynthesis